MARAETIEDYRAMGKRYAVQGQARYPDCDPLESLCRHAEDRTGVLRPSTVRLYKRRYCAAAIVIGRTGDMDREVIMAVLRRLMTTLDSMAGTPPEPRTSSKKVKDAKDWEVKEVFGHLKIMAVRHKRIRSAAVALYCPLVPRLGPRPVELTRAWVEGNTLFVPSAKQPEGEQKVREIDISDFHPTHREALLALIYIVARDVEASGYDAWLSLLAEILARACETVSKNTGQRIERLAPSSFRHTAISTWHAAGYTAEEIAELVGHRNLRSQNAYKRSSSAWPITGPLAKPAAQPTVTIDLNAMPVPTASQVKTMVENPDTPDGLGDEPPPPDPKLI